MDHTLEFWNQQVQFGYLFGDLEFRSMTDYDLLLTIPPDICLCGERMIKIKMTHYYLSAMKRLA